MRVHDFFQELRNLLLANQEIKDVVGFKIFSYKIPDSAEYPYITIRSKDYDRGFTISNVDKWLTFGSLDFWVYGKDPAEINMVQQELEDTLHLATFQTENFLCKNIVCISGQNAFQPDIDKYPDLYVSYSSFRAEISIK